LKRDTVLLAYGELSLKSKPVRRMLEDRIVKQASLTLRRAGVRKFSVYRKQGRIIVKCEEAEKAAEVLSRLFGIVYAIPAVEVDANLNSIIQAARELAVKEIGEGETFAVRARVVGEHPFRSKDVESAVGAVILEALKDRSVSVNLDNPDKTVYVEVRDSSAYLYTELLDGPGGLPYGSQGRLVCLFSGGIDSPVACWLMMKRGVFVIPLFLDQRPYVGEDYVDRAMKVAKRIRVYAPVKRFPMVVVPFGEFMRLVEKSSEKRLRCILCKRGMYRVASTVAEKERCQGFITGESLGQVASQTTHNLMVIEEAASKPVFRPLIGMDKVETEHLAMRIGTYELSAKSVHGCTLVPKKPSTRARLSKVKRIEEELGLVEAALRCVEGARRLYL